MSLDYESRQAFAARARAARAAGRPSRVMRWTGAAAYAVIASFGWVIVLAALGDEDEVGWIIAVVGCVIAIPCSVRLVAVARLARRGGDGLAMASDVGRSRLRNEDSAR